MTFPCTTNPAVFDSHGGDEDLRVLVAKALCSECPVQLACRIQARENREWGVWGGESERERAWAGYHCVLPRDEDTPGVSLDKEAARVQRAVIGADGRAQCPSVAAYKRHGLYGEDREACGCKEFYKEYKRAERAARPKKPREVEPCPSVAAYKRHTRKGEDPGPCGCRAVATASREDLRTRELADKTRKLSMSPHIGSALGYKTHLRQGEASGSGACGCRVAHTAARAEERARTKERRELVAA
ncbi:WhiB family transcriptional regulator [Streptomyces sp. NPDC018055]|uniref:WhiB family transcriptional regulator n=1 Tax=Streptomyces sp. NPDC018055 TaxID=3365038 RepID=UPI0037885D47